MSSDELEGDSPQIVTCAVCDTEWDSEAEEECPECGSEKVWDMEAAFREAGFEMVEATPSLSVPSAYPATFSPTDELAADRVEQLEENLPEAIGMVSTFYREADSGVYHRAKMFDRITNQMWRVKVTSGRVRVYPADEDFSFKTFRRAVHTLEDVLDTELEPEEQDDAE